MNPLKGTEYRAFRFAALHQPSYAANTSRQPITGIHLIIHLSEVKSPSNACAISSKAAKVGMKVSNLSAHFQHDLPRAFHVALGVHLRYGKSFVAENDLSHIQSKLLSILCRRVVA